MSAILIVLTATSVEVDGSVVIEHLQISPKPPDDVGYSDSFRMDVNGMANGSASKTTGRASCVLVVAGCSITTAPGASPSSTMLDGLGRSNCTWTCDVLIGIGASCCRVVISDTGTDMTGIVNGRVVESARVAGLSTETALPFPTI